ncbi:MAG: 3'(2'),5'-bisphosphate nucleotidase CysQ [Amaricoccus sp.]
MPGTEAAPAPGSELALLIEAAEASGRIAMRHFRHGPKVWDKPDGHGPVTEADLAVDRMLHERLLAARPDYGWLSEESTDDPARLSARRVFILDPIDGTRAFIAGEKSWSHSLAVAEQGRVVAGVVHLPALQRTYAATEGGGATLNGAPLAVSSRDEIEGATVLANAAQLDPKHWAGKVPRMERHFRPSLAYRLCLVAEGRFDAMLSFRGTWEWDVAAGDLIAREAGARVTNAEGRPLVYNAPVPMLPGIIAGAPSVHAAILAQV